MKKLYTFAEQIIFFTSYKQRAKMLIQESIASLRQEYKKASLSENQIAKTPIKQFEIWFNEALHADVIEPNAMHLCTISPDGEPSGRIVLLKGIEPKGFVFYTNYDSQKGHEMALNASVSLTFFWADLERQVRIQGIVKKVSEQISDAYFNSRPRSSRIGAWVSEQSKEILPDELEKRLVFFEEKFKDSEVPRPPHWGGYVLEPHYMEFWQGRPSRLHDRIVYELDKNKQNWRIFRLAP